MPWLCPTPRSRPYRTAPRSARSLRAHIELNAIDLAWDTVVRFSVRAPRPPRPCARRHRASLRRLVQPDPGSVASLSGVLRCPIRPGAFPCSPQRLHPQLPEEFFRDFARVADDESRHLGWCLQRLRELGHDYGDVPAHNQLWVAAQSTAGDLSDRLVIVPCVQEARGLDAGVRLADRLKSAGDRRSAEIVLRIAEEEKAHVARRPLTRSPRAERDDSAERMLHHLTTVRLGLEMPVLHSTPHPPLCSA